MKKIIVSLLCMLLVSVSTLGFALNPKSEYKGQAFAPGKFNLGKIGVYPTDVIIINNTASGIFVSAPGIDRDYLGANGVYRLTSTASISPEVILWTDLVSVVYDKFVQPHSIISFAYQRGNANTITVEYY